MATALDSQIAILKAQLATLETQRERQAQAEAHQQASQTQHPQLAAPQPQPELATQQPNKPPHPSPKNKRPTHPAQWRASSSTRVIGWTRKKGCWNPKNYGVAVNSKMTVENCEVLRVCGQKFASSGVDGEFEEGDDVEDAKRKKKAKGSAKEKLVLDEGKVFWFARFGRDGSEGKGKLC